MVTDELRRENYARFGPFIIGDTGKYAIQPSDGCTRFAELELKVVGRLVEFKISSSASTFVPAYSDVGNCEMDDEEHIGLQIVRGANNFFFGQALYKALFTLHMPAETPPAGTVDKLVWRIAGKVVTIDLSDPRMAVADFDCGDGFRIPRDVIGAADELVNKLRGVLSLHSVLERLDKITRDS